MVSGNRTVAERLQDCRDDLGQVNAEIERNRGLTEEVLRLTEELNRTKHELDQAAAVGPAERRLLNERVRSAEAAEAEWTRRAMAAERQWREQAAVLAEIRQLVEGKSCILPQIARLVGVRG